ncbi:hypothetical protein BLJ79_07910 [Arthrobacter sp. UCD-GKA]|uniref:IclR family transcriptional regulator n=1 Tax=Arthrobacter sp. UCD-GKA TaxID=1913576 RepID=UPI0008DCA8BE|nr:IclR family transcriptional regulator [Arthrobacter sp. UCD-GKA]OIH85107.1 hypothetical protein BLJ79_07910 [Arthrobacter sp. UCD-GKA]
MSSADPLRTNSLLPGTGRNESLQRAFDLLEVMAQIPQGASIAQLSIASDLPRSTVARLLASLFDAGVVARPGSDRHWVLGPTIMRLTRAVTPAFDLPERSSVIMQQITDELEETTMLAVPTGQTTARVINEIRGPKLIGVTSPWAGQSIDSPASGFVRQLLAEMPKLQSDKIVHSMIFERHTPKTIVDGETLKRAIEKIRKDGYAVVVDEFEEGLAGLALPVRRDGQLSGMLAVYLPTHRLTVEFRKRALESLTRGVKKLE